MPIDRRLLIFGNALLFSAIACDDGGEVEPLPDTEVQARDGRVEPDAAPDMAPDPDMAPEADMAWVSDMAPDPDMASEADMASLDMTPDGAPTVDMAPEPDLAPPLDAEPDMAPDPDMALVDMAPPVPDMAPPAMCPDLIGSPCQVADEGCCPDGQNPQAVCWGDANGRLSWQTIPGDFFCNCFLAADQTSYQVACAVPGFVGIERAGRRLRGPRLRALLAA